MELWITEDFLGNGGMITGIGQSSGNIGECHNYGREAELFFRPDQKEWRDIQI